MSEGLCFKLVVNTVGGESNAFEQARNRHAMSLDPHICRGLVVPFFSQTESFATGASRSFSERLWFQVSLGHAHLRRVEPPITEHHSIPLGSSKTLLVVNRFAELCAVFLQKCCTKEAVHSCSAQLLKFCMCRRALTKMWDSISHAKSTTAKQHCQCEFVKHIFRWCKRHKGPHNGCDWPWQNSKTMSKICQH